MPKSISFKPIDVAIKEPEFVISDFAKFSCPALCHIAFQALSLFEKETGRKPLSWCEEDSVKFVEFFNKVRELNPTLNVDEKFDVEYVKTFAKVCAGDLAPMDAVIGGIVAQEVLKACSGKFTPISQWLYFDAIECLPEKNDLPSKNDTTPLNSRYDAQIAVFGKNFQEK